MEQAQSSLKFVCLCKVSHWSSQKGILNLFTLPLCKKQCCLRCLLFRKEFSNFSKHINIFKSLMYWNVPTVIFVIFPETATTKVFKFLNVSCNFLLVCTSLPNIAQQSLIFYSTSEYCTALLNNVHNFLILYGTSKYCTARPNIVQHSLIMYSTS
jgi:hypothetical protein